MLRKQEVQHGYLCPVCVCRVPVQLAGSVPHIVPCFMPECCGLYHLTNPRTGWGPTERLKAFWRMQTEQHHRRNSSCLAFMFMFMHVASPVSLPTLASLPSFDRLNAVLLIPAAAAAAAADYEIPSSTARPAGFAVLQANHSHLRNLGWRLVRSNGRNFARIRLWVALLGDGSEGTRGWERRQSHILPLSLWLKTTGADLQRC